MHAIVPTLDRFCADRRPASRDSSASLFGLPPQPAIQELASMLFRDDARHRTPG